MVHKLLQLLLVSLLITATSAVPAQVPPRDPAGRPAPQPSIQPRRVQAINPAQVRGFEQLRQQANQSNRRVRVIARLSSGAVEGTPNTSSITPAPFARSAPGLAAAQTRLEGRLAQLGVPHAARIEGLPLVVVEASAEELVQMIADGEIAEIVEDELAEPMLRESNPLVRAPSPIHTSSPVTIAILDTGIETSHPFFGKRVVEEACYSSNSPANNATSLCPNRRSRSMAAGSGAACSGMAGCDHGTHVAGIAAGRATRNREIRFNGIAPDANLFSIQVFSRIADSATNRPCADLGRASPCVLSFTSDLLRALQHVRERQSARNIVAVNMSLGGGLYTAACDDHVLKPIIDELRAAGVATVVASGNAGSRDSISAPACISSAIAVGSTTKSDAISSFSNTSRQVDLLAPGSSIRSSVPGGDLATMNGTSMAAPHVAGAVAAIRLRRPDASVNQVVAWLKLNGVPVTVSGIRLARIDVDSAARTHRAMFFTLKQTYQVDFDSGQNSGATADLWFQAETATSLFLVPRNGATMWVGDRSQRGYLGCSAGTAYSTNRVALSNLPVGSFVCIKTNQGRFSQFRIDSISSNSPRVLGISYVTWNE